MAHRVGSARAAAAPAVARAGAVAGAGERAVAEPEPEPVDDAAAADGSDDDKGGSLLASILQRHAKRLHGDEEEAAAERKRRRGRGRGGRRTGKRGRRRRVGGVVVAGGRHRLVGGNARGKRPAAAPPTTTTTSTSGAAAARRRRGARASSAATARSPPPKRRRMAMEEEAADGDDDGAEAAAAAAAAAAAMVDDDDEEVDGWPRLNGKVEPPMPKEPLMMGPRPRHEGNSIYPRMAVLPASFNQYLRPYQKEGIAWLWRQYSQDRGGILGDEMGLGKTVQTIGFISAVLGKTCTREDRDRGFPLAEGDCRQVLVVAPTSTLANWHREFTTWGCFRVRKCHGAEKEEALRAAARRECEVVLTTYGMVLANAEELAAVPWEVTIWDEVHTIKNHKSKTNIAAQLIPCQRRYGLTGTPMSNDYQESGSSSTSSRAKKSATRRTSTSSTRALKDGQQRLARQDQLATRLRRQEQLKGLMDRWMLQRFKTIISDQLPKKEDTIVFCEMAARQKRVYKRVLESTDYVMLATREDPCPCGSGAQVKDCHGFDPDGVLWQAHHIDENGEVMESCPKCEGSGGCSRCIGMPAITKLMRIANHLELLKPDERSTCKKCGPCRAKQFDACEKTARELAFARMAMGQEHSGSLLRDASFLSQSSDSHCGKMQTLKQLLRMWHKKQQKVLLFSYSTQMLDILEDFVTRLAYSHLRLDGSTPQARRQKLVDEFNSTPASRSSSSCCRRRRAGWGSIW